MKNVCTGRQQTEACGDIGPATGHNRWKHNGSPMALLILRQLFPGGSIVPATHHDLWKKNCYSKELLILWRAVGSMPDYVDWSLGAASISIGLWRIRKSTKCQQPASVVNHNANYQQCKGCQTVIQTAKP